MISGSDGRACFNHKSVRDIETNIRANTFGYCHTEVIDGPRYSISAKVRGEPCLPDALFLLPLLLLLLLLLLFPFVFFFSPLASSSSSSSSSSFPFDALKPRGVFLLLLLLLLSYTYTLIQKYTRVPRKLDELRGNLSLEIQWHSWREIP